MACEDDPRHEKLKVSFIVFKTKTTFLGYLDDIYLGNCHRCDSTIGFEILPPPVESPAQEFSAGK